MQQPDGFPRVHSQGTIGVDVLVHKYVHPQSSHRGCYACGLKDMEQQVKDAEIIIQAHDRRLCPSLSVVLSVVSNSCGCEVKQLKSETRPKRLRKARRSQKSRLRPRSKRTRQDQLVCLLR